VGRPGLPATGCRPTAGVPGLVPVAGRVAGREVAGRLAGREAAGRPAGRLPGRARAPDGRDEGARAYPPRAPPAARPPPPLARWASAESALGDRRIRLCGEVPTDNAKTSRPTKNRFTSHPFCRRPDRIRMLHQLPPIRCATLSGFGHAIRSASSSGTKENASSGISGSKFQFEK
jgi:hypothetical protein